jgi:hypothetical protein
MHYMQYLEKVKYESYSSRYYGSRERYQIIFKTITNNNFRFYYVSSKLDQVLLLLLLTNKLLLLKKEEKRISKEHQRQTCSRFYYQLKDDWWKMTKTYYFFIFIFLKHKLERQSLLSSSYYLPVNCIKCEIYHHILRIHTYDIRLYYVLLSYVIEKRK